MFRITPLYGYHIYHVHSEALICAVCMYEVAVFILSSLAQGRSLGEGFWGVELPSKVSVAVKREMGIFQKSLLGELEEIL